MPEKEIKKIVMGIKNNEYVLPVIQRELVWDYEQIEQLFDSVMSGYPFGSMLFWNYEHNSDCKYKFYEFLKKYDEYTPQSRHNPEYNPAGEKKLTAVLDGQQRLTALYLGLLGWLNLHKPRTYYNKAENYEKKYLYINLFYQKDPDFENAANEYEFKFKTIEEVQKENNSQKFLWFKVGDILDFESDKDYRKKLGDVYSQAPQEIKDRLGDLFSDLYKNFVEKKVVSYFEEDTKSFDRVLQIFVRINSGGTPLGYTDLLMSVIINQWGDGRDKINQAIDTINDECHFNIPKDIFLRGCLFLTGLPLIFKADNFERQNVGLIEKSFDDIVKYIKSACRIFKELGYSKDNLRSNLIVLPLALFLYQNRLQDPDIENKRKILRWIQLSVINRVFGAQTTAYLNKLRNIIEKSGGRFPLNEIKSESRLMNRSMETDEENLELLIEKAQYGSQDSWSLLTLLQPDLAFEDKKYHEDHIYPASSLTKEQLNDGGNYLANLQLLEDSENLAKQDKNPEKWLDQYCRQKGKNKEDYKTEHCMPLLELSEENFSAFLQERKRLIKQALTLKLAEDF